MIEWFEYDSTSREIESHKNHLITDGLNIWVAQHAKNLISPGYGWHLGDKEVLFTVTHWAKINLPLEESK